MSVDRGSFLKLADLASLAVIQPAVAIVAILGLATSREATTALTQPLFVWGGVSLLLVIFAEGVWSFAHRHAKRERLGMLWGKLVGAGVCAILAFASAYKHLGLIDGGAISHDAGTALYFSITAWTTAAYGDVIATIAARPFAAAQALFGFGYNTALIGIILHAITFRDHK
jgi:hypothetical protein